MSLGSMLTGPSGAAFSKALTVKLPKSKAFEQGFAQGFRGNMARARQGVQAQRLADRKKVEASKTFLGVDEKLQGEANEAAIGYYEGVDQASIEAGGDPYLASQLIAPLFNDFQIDAANLLAEDNKIKALRKKAAENNVLVPERLQSYLADKDQRVYTGGSLKYIPGLDFLGETSGTSDGQPVGSFPLKVDADDYDVNRVKKMNEADKLALFLDVGEPVGAPKIEKIQNKTIQTQTYRLPREVVRDYVAKATAKSPDYLANIGLSYYNDRKKNYDDDAVFESELGVKYVNGELIDEIIDFRTDQIMKSEGITTSRTISGTESTRVNVTVNTGEAVEDTPTAGLMSYNHNLKVRQQDGTYEDAKAPGIGYGVTMKGIKLAGATGAVDVLSNEPSNIIEAFDFEPVNLLVVPIFSSNLPKKDGSGQSYNRSGKIVPLSTYNKLWKTGQVKYESFYLGEGTDVKNTEGNIVEKKTLYVPSSQVSVANKGASTKAEVADFKAQKKIIAEVSAIRDMLNSEPIGSEAHRLNYEYLNNPSNYSLSVSLVNLAEKQGYLARYMKDGEYVLPQETGAKTSGKIPVETSRDEPGGGTTTPAPASNSKPKTTTTPKPKEEEKPKGTRRQNASEFTGF